MNEELSFNLLLDANPDDYLTRLVYADWLQDRDDPRAAGYRRLGELFKYPMRDTHKGRIRKEIPGRVDDWGYTIEGNSFGLTTCQLPEEWFRKMRDMVREVESVTGWDWWCWFEYRRQAEDAAALAFNYL